MIHGLRDIFNADEKSVCLYETNSVNIEIYDCYDCIQPEQRSYIRTKQDEPVHFTLSNPNLETLCFGAIDNCLLGAQDPARCDFLIGNIQRLFFVEIKNTVVSQRRAARANAIDQLDGTIGYFRKKAGLTKTELIGLFV